MLAEVRRAIHENDVDALKGLARSNEREFMHAITGPINGVPVPAYAVLRRSRACLEYLLQRLQDVPGYDYTITLVQACVAGSAAMCTDIVRSGARMSLRFFTELLGAPSLDGPLVALLETCAARALPEPEDLCNWEMNGRNIQHVVSRRIGELERVGGRDADVRNLEELLQYIRQMRREKTPGVLEAEEQQEAAIRAAAQRAASAAAAAPPSDLLSDPKRDALSRSSASSSSSAWPAAALSSSSSSAWPAAGLSSSSSSSSAWPAAGLSSSSSSSAWPAAAPQNDARPRPFVWPSSSSSSVAAPPRVASISLDRAASAAPPFTAPLHSTTGGSHYAYKRAASLSSEEAPPEPIRSSDPSVLRARSMVRVVPSPSSSSYSSPPRARTTAIAPSPSASLAPAAPASAADPSLASPASAPSPSSSRRASTTATAPSPSSSRRASTTATAPSPSASKRPTDDDAEGENKLPRRDDA